jgi:hypothetical protein
MGHIVAVISAVAGFVTAVLVKGLADDFSAWLPWIAERIIRRAVASLPENQRERYSEEWRGSLIEVPGTISKLFYAIDFLRAGVKMSRILSTEPSQLPEDAEPVTPGPLVSLRIVFGAPVPNGGPLIQAAEIKIKAAKRGNA